jgi:hypothetical protein
MPGTEVWAVEHYDWSDPDIITWTVKESNFCAPGSYVSTTITPGPTGGNHLHVVWNRAPTTLVGRMAALMIRLTRGRPVAASMKQGLANL